MRAAAGPAQPVLPGTQSGHTPSHLAQRGRAQVGPPPLGAHRPLPHLFWALSLPLKTEVRPPALVWGGRDAGVVEQSKRVLLGTASSGWPDNRVCRTPAQLGCNRGASAGPGPAAESSPPGHTSCQILSTWGDPSLPCLGRAGSASPAAGNHLGEPFWTQRHILGTTPTWPWSNPEVTPPLHPLLAICGPSFEASYGGVGSSTASSGTHSICFGRDRDSILLGLLFPFPSPNQTCQQCFLHF